jgi:hypothetical protein
MFSVALIGVLTHVPQYGTACVDNCCHLIHEPNVSQAVYLKGSGGAEIGIESMTVPFDILGGEHIHFDAVFREEYDQTTFDLYVGCGGCMATDDLVVRPFPIRGYKPFRLEPFTQTGYYGFRTRVRDFDNTISASTLDECDEEHFTVRLVDYGNRTTDDPIRWSAVMGRLEQFTTQELVEFPIYVLSNHGDAWNELEYTYWIWLGIGAPLIILALDRVVLFFGGKALFWRRTQTARSVSYFFALVGFVAAALEQFTHLLYVQAGNAVGVEFWVALFLVILLAQGGGALFTIVLWKSMYDADVWYKTDFWGPFEILTALSLLFLLGSGFYIGPVFLVFGGSVRTLRLLTAGTRSNEEPRNNRDADVAQPSAPKLVMNDAASSTQVFEREVRVRNGTRNGSMGLTPHDHPRRI